jgi:low temperature requirement protein LtrA
MTERAIDEPHRVASPLELLFDLTFVVAIASITAQLAHGIAEGTPSSR